VPVESLNIEQEKHIVIEIDCITHVIKLPSRIIVKENPIIQKAHKL